MSETPATPASKPRVLVADDEQVIANTLAIILNQAGFEARAVYSGEKAREALDKQQSVTILVISIDCATSDRYPQGIPI